ncbi:glyoxalase superfamily protein [Methylobacterium sp. J-068]|uniref:glyoxalase superfamily protein n=1 Tax=Methylobacterium sp. J-068 TaxID=2836649 RepID=UPI001FBB176B|nr:glyoxalase superfamily protein [Methylobacterium sp. J-068]MCJ2036665.1 glyoxalase superfamily protein [Methylobacterium sp. J-068]
MLDVSHAKAMARTLRDGLSERSIALSHSDCLELVAHQFGFANWNVLAARLDAPKRSAPALALPKGWFVTGSVTPGSHRLGLDPTAPGTILIESLLERPAGLGSLTDRIAVLMQSVQAAPFLGRRLRLGADLRCREADCGTIWMRVDGLERRSLAFDNLMTRAGDGPVSGDHGWTWRSIVLDVSGEAASLHFGIFLKGYGKLWARHLRLEVVDLDVPVTGGAHSEVSHDTSRLAAEPSNLGFTEV